MQHKGKVSRRQLTHQTYQADVTEVKQAERSGGDGFSLDEVFQDIRGRCLDVAIVLTDTQSYFQCCDVILLTFMSINVLKHTYVI